MTTCKLIEQLKALITPLKDDARIEAINEIRKALHELSPFKNEPVDCVLWLTAEQLKANDYNPNNVAPAEKQLLYTSLVQDGYTQPIVVSATTGQQYMIVDGYHRYEMGTKRPELRKRLHGYLPTVLMNDTGQDKSNRIAATIRHNRARGRHQINAMAEIVRELSRLGWKDEKIGRELGMDEDEVLRLKQVSGLFEMFSHRKFSTAWTVK